MKEFSFFISILDPINSRSLFPKHLLLPNDVVKFNQNTFLLVQIFFIIPFLLNDLLDTTQSFQDFGIGLENIPKV